MGLLDSVVDIAKAATYGSPIGIAVDVIDKVVESVGNGIDNKDVILLLEKVAKSTHNNVDDKLIQLIKCYLKED